jgi:cytoskeletal protein CcmA (bactofilin family)
MLSDKKNRKSNATSVEPGSSQNRINEGTHIKGDITSNGFFRIDGIIEGTITTPSKVVIGKNGVITGNLSCENADIEGSFNGNLKVSQLLTLRGSAMIEGDVVVGKLSVEPGATFNATCRMHGEGVSTASKQSSPYDRSQRSKKKGTEQFN